MLALKFGKSVGAIVSPMDHVVATSGLSADLPSISSLHSPDTHCPMVPVYFVPPLVMAPYCAAVTPECAHCASEALGAVYVPVEALNIGAHGSVATETSPPTEGALYSSTRFGARTARSKEKRMRASLMGAYCTSNL